MRMGKGMVVGLLCLVLVFSICLPRASSGAVTTYLDDTWFKMKLTAKGYKRDVATGAIETYNFQAPVYLHFTWFPVNNWYRIDVWTLQDATWKCSLGNITIPYAPERTSSPALYCLSISEEVI